jgi:hypothetical protein
MVRLLPLYMRSTPPSLQYDLMSVNVQPSIVNEPGFNTNRLLLNAEAGGVKRQLRIVPAEFAVTRTALPSPEIGVLAPRTVKPSTVAVIGSPTVKLMHGKISADPSRVVTSGPPVDTTWMFLPLNSKPPV